MIQYEGRPVMAGDELTMTHPNGSYLQFRLGSPILGRDRVEKMLQWGWELVGRVPAEPKTIDIRIENNIDIWTWHVKAEGALMKSDYWADYAGALAKAYEYADSLMPRHA